VVDTELAERDEYASPELGRSSGRQLMTNHHLSRRAGDQLPADWNRANGLDRPSDGGWAPQDADESSFDWRSAASAIIRHKWIVLLGALLGTGAAYAAWQRVETGLWVANGSLWLQPAATEQGPIVTDRILATSSQVMLIESNSVLDSVVMQQKLYLSTSPEDAALFESFMTDAQARARPQPLPALAPALDAGGTSPPEAVPTAQVQAAAPADSMPEPPISAPLPPPVPFQPGAYVLRVESSGSGVVLLRDGIEVQRGVVGDTLGRPSGFVWVPPAEALTPGREIPFGVTAPRDAASTLAAQLTPTMDPAGSFIRVTMTGTDTARLAAVVNSVMERHVALAGELKSGHLREQTLLLERQLRAAAAQREAASAALTAFRVATATQPSENVSIQPGLAMAQGPVFDQFWEMRIQQEAVRRDRQAIQQVLATVPATPEAPFPVEAIELIPAVTTSSQLGQSIAALVAARLERETLLLRYTSAHQDVVAVDNRIRALERETLPSLLRQMVGQLESQELELSSRIEASGVELSAIPTRTVQEENLRLELTLADNLYTDLSQRYETAKLAQQSSQSDVRIVDRAVVTPLPRAADRRAAIAAVLFLALLGAGMTGAVMVDRMDPHMRTPDQVATVLGLTILGVIPRIRRGSTKDESMDQAREAFRGLRTNLEYAHGSAGPMVVTISSPGPSEGKTLVTSNLGMCLAELGRRTLIIDGDTRRGDLHRVLEGERKPGLTDYLRGKETVDKVVQATAHPHLQFIGSGTQVANSPELLSSSRMGELMAEMRKRYDVILVDSPPLGVGADALVLGCLSANMLLLLRSGSTHQDFAQARLEPLARLPLRLLGAVLNDYQPDRLASPYQTYYGSYLPGYEAGAEEEQAALEGEPA
jgi:capsular exopolysaccharide synthesis family protein